MARIETTGGDVIITGGQCDCGLTGGCEKCKPIIISKHPLILIIKPITSELQVIANQIK